MGVFGRLPGMGGARVNGEYSCPGARRYGSERPIAAAGVSRVGVIGVTPFVALKNVGLLKIPGEIGIALWGKTNFGASLVPFCKIWLMGWVDWTCSPVGGVALPLLMESLL